jgi:hypothetical protein
MSNTTSPNPLAYTGLDVFNTPQAIPVNRAPATTDWQSFLPGDFWRDTSVTPPITYLLESVAGNVAIWRPISQPTSIPVSTIAVDAFTAPGTNPVVPDGAGAITVTGAQVASGVVGTNVIRTASLAANTYTTQIQRATVSILSDATRNGVSHFNSADFTINASGFVSLLASPGSTTTSFYAWLSATQSNVTGNGTNFLIPYNMTVYNINAGFNTATNRFVAQETGVHRFVSAIDLEGILNTHTSFEVNLVVVGASGATYLMSRATAAGERTSINDMTINSGIEVFMTAGDTAQIQITVAGGALVVDVEGGTATQSGYFAGSFVTAVSLPGLVTWFRISANQTLVINQGYFCVAPGGALVLPLPTLADIGNIIEIALQGATSWQVTQGAGQQIFIGASSTTLGAGGSLASTAQGNSIRMVCSQTNTTWQVVSSMGSITVV